MSAPMSYDSVELAPSAQQAQSLRESASHYFFKSPNELKEGIFCFSVFSLGKLLPFLWSLWYPWERPIPFEKTSAGDVLLELDLSYELSGRETVPDWLAVVLCIVLPVVLFIVVGFRWGRNGDVHASMCFYFVSVGTTWFLTDFVKVYAGQLRPNFYDMCEFNKDTLQCETDNIHLMRQSRKSFPSGHSSLAFSSMMALSLYFVGKVGIQRNAHMESPSLQTKIYYLLSFSPMLLAFFIATSRVHDFWHHPADVVAGAVIGVACALFMHGMWYPSIYSSWSGYPLHTLHMATSAADPSLVPNAIDDQTDQCL